MKRCVWLFAAVFTFVSAGSLRAQGTQTGTITGEVKATDDSVLPGTTVSVHSPSLQGVRTAVTDATGGYIVKALPPGDYTVTFTLNGMKTIEKKVALVAGSSLVVSATLPVADLQETVTVVAEAPSILQQSTLGTTVKADQVDLLATSRTIFGVTELQPGLTARGASGDITMSGAFSYDNVFLINGVDVNDNAFGTPTSLFIEDAIEDFQVLTGGISAEYGRFSGGVVNAITKRGGNAFAGSFRVDFTNSSWRDENPIEKRSGTERADITNEDYQATLGGPVLKDRLWFFVAGRTADRTTSNTLLVTNIPYDGTNSNDRLEVKLTGSLTPNHTLQASYISNKNEETGPSLANYAGDTDTFYNPPRTLPSHLFVANYNGVLSTSLFAEVQYSEKKFTFENSGGSSTDVRDSPIFTLSSAYSPQHYWNAPYFDNTDPESRDNRQFSANLSYFLTTAGMGRHDLKLGYENFQSSNTGGNSQSATNYYFYADYLGGPGTPIRDAQGKMQPIWLTGENIIVQYLATRGAHIDVTTQSLYLNDRWQINSRLSANLGVRYEKVRSEATGGIVGADTDTIVPRLALGWDVRGDGSWKLDATYSQYSGKFTEGQFGNNTVVGNPASAYYLYTGPNGVGRDFGPGMDPAYYTEFLGGNVPTQNIFFESGMSSPKTTEMTLSAGRALPRAGFLRLTYILRDTNNFIESFTDTTTGDTNVTLPDGTDLGPLDNTVYRNSDEPSREYEALQLQGSFRPTSAWSIDGHWTYQIKNDGDFEGEGVNTPGTASIFGDYPEVFSAARHYPLGRLDDYQRHKVVVSSTYQFGLGGAGSFDLGLLYRYDSGFTASRTATNVRFSSIQNAGRALYASPPSTLSNTVFFGPRGAEEFSGSHEFNAALTYRLKVFKSLRPYIKADVRNVFNKAAQIDGRGTVIPDPTSPLDALGLPTGYGTPANFRQAAAGGDYQIPREFRFSLGFHF